MRLTLILILGCVLILDSAMLGQLPFRQQLRTVERYEIALRPPQVTIDPWSGVTGIDQGDIFTWENGSVLGDVDGDGDLDMVRSFPTPAEPTRVAVYINDGSPDQWLTQPHTILTAGGTVQRVALADVDGDRNLDVVVQGNFYGVGIFLNNGTQDPFLGVTGYQMAVGPTTPRMMVLGDVDGDDDVDLIMGFSGPEQLFLNNGTNSPFQGVQGVEITHDFWGAESMQLGDMDGDLDLDLVVLRRGPSCTMTVRWYENNGTGDPFAGVMGIDISRHADCSGDILLGDVDGDRDLDLVVSPLSADCLVVLNNGTQDPWYAASTQVIHSEGSLCIALGDVDSDGDLDLVSGFRVRQAPDEVHLYLNNGTAVPFDGVASITTAGTGEFPTVLLLGDLSGDGELDLAVGCFMGNSFVFVNNGTPTYWPLRPSPLAPVRRW